MLAATFGFSAEPGSVPAPLPDYAFAYHPYGYRGRDGNGHTLYGVQTSRYGMVVNASKSRVERFGAIDDPKPIDEAAGEGFARLKDLPGAGLRFFGEVGGGRYEAVRAAAKPEDLVLQRVGRWLESFELRGVEFEDADGKKLEGVEARIEFFCWPDRLAARLRLKGARALAGAKLFAEFKAPPEWPTAHELTPNLVWHEAQPGAGTEIALASADGAGRGAAMINPFPKTQMLRFADGAKMRCETEGVDLAEGAEATISVALLAAPKGILDLAFAEHLDTCNPLSASVIRAAGVAPYAGALAVDYDPVAGWYRVLLGQNGDIFKNERVHITIENPYPQARMIRLNFAKEGGGFGVTGMSPVICASGGGPLGLPTQISKNWHIHPAWFNGLTALRIEPGAKLEFDFALAYAKWGELPAVSHAQLALEGWGGHQQWDQMAIGSFGESITYDPEIGLNRSMIDDVRPLMVWGMGPKEKTQWSWTHNVGGGDFLVLEVKDGEKTKRLPLAAQRSLNASQGPVMSDVAYCGEAAGGALRSRIRTQTWQADDFVRGVYTIRYDVEKEIGGIERLAFFQLGADRYNDHEFGEAARGDAGGMKEKWEPGREPEKYSRRSEPLPGEGAWISFHQARKPPPPHTKEGDQGAFANRGMIVRRWNARLGGAEVEAPSYSIRGMAAGNLRTAQAELSPPPGLRRLLPGDFVEAVVEFIIVPQRAEDYYGPNEPLRKFLEGHPDSWEVVEREAALGEPRAEMLEGSVENLYPLVIRPAEGRRARFGFAPGAGWAAVTIAGAAGREFELVRKTADGEERILPRENGEGWSVVSRQSPVARRQSLVVSGQASVVSGEQGRVTGGGYDILFVLPLDRGGEYEWRGAGEK